MQLSEIVFIWETKRKKKKKVDREVDSFRTVLIVDMPLQGIPRPVIFDKTNYFFKHRSYTIFIQ